MKRGKDGSVPGYNAQLVVQPDLKLGLFAAMSTGPGGREVPFFADVLVELGLEVVPAMAKYLQNVQPSKLPPVPEAFCGTYNFGDMVLEIGFGSSAAPLGNSTLVVLRNTLGWPALQPLVWVSEDTLEMIPLPGQLCFSDEGGENWAMHFHRAAPGALATAVELQGIGVYPAVLYRAGRESNQDFN